MPSESECEEMNERPRKKEDEVIEDNAVSVDPLADTDLPADIEKINSTATKPKRRGAQHVDEEESDDDNVPLKKFETGKKRSAPKRTGDHIDTHSKTVTKKPKRGSNITKDKSATSKEEENIQENEHKSPKKGTKNAASSAKTSKVKNSKETTTKARKSAKPVKKSTTKTNSKNRRQSNGSDSDYDPINDLDTIDGGFAHYRYKAVLQGAGRGSRSRGSRGRGRASGQRKTKSIRFWCRPSEYNKVLSRLLAEEKGYV